MSPERPPANVALPKDPVLLRMVARLLAKREEWDALASVLSLLEEISPTYWRTTVQLAVALENSGDHELARTTIVRRMDASGHTGVRRGVIEHLFHLGRSELFAVALKAYARSDPKSLWSYVLRAQGGRLGDAFLDAIRKGILGDIGPENWRTAVQLAVAFENSGDVGMARTVVVSRMAAMGHTAAARRAIVATLFELGRSELFLAALDAYAHSDPNSLRSYVIRAQGPLGDALLDAVGGLVPGWDPIEIALTRIQGMESAGRTEEADRADAAIEPSMTIEAAPAHATPTASTLMFRNPLLLDALVSAAEWFIERKGTASIHVGACSTGEEVYSLAMLLDDRGLIDRCAITASDVDPVSVRRARTGVIESRARSAIPDTLFQTYFELRKDGRPKLRTEILQLLRFSVEDLSKKASARVQYDLLIANNVLVHFPVDAASLMLSRMVQRVQPGGILCIGGARQDRLGDTIGESGLIAVTAQAEAIFDGWRLQRRAWYINPRRYWALPPARHTAADPWRHSALFARSGDTADALQARLLARASASD